MAALVSAIGDLEGTDTTGAPEGDRPRKPDIAPYQEDCTGAILPPEILLLIMAAILENVGYGDKRTSDWGRLARGAKDILPLRMVCRYWYHLAGDSTMWKDMARKVADATSLTHIYRGAFAHQSRWHLLRAKEAYYVLYPACDWLSLPPPALATLPVSPDAARYFVFAVGRIPQRELLCEGCHLSTGKMATEEYSYWRSACPTCGKGGTFCVPCRKSNTCCLGCCPSDPIEAFLNGMDPYDVIYNYRRRAMRMRPFRTVERVCDIDTSHGDLSARRVALVQHSIKAVDITRAFDMRVKTLLCTDERECSAEDFRLLVQDLEDVLAQVDAAGLITFNMVNTIFYHL
jgi:hypothetical protein